MVPFVYPYHVSGKFSGLNRVVESAVGGDKPALVGDGQGDIEAVVNCLSHGDGRSKNNVQKRHGRLESQGQPIDRLSDGGGINSVDLAATKLFPEDIVQFSEQEVRSTKSTS